MRSELSIRKFSILLPVALFCASRAVLVRAAEPARAAEPQAQEAAGPFARVPLGFPMNSLSPYISEETVEYHYGKHYKANVDALNKLVAGKPEAAMSLDKIIMTAAPGPLFNNAAQTWNHAFYFSSLRPDGGGEPSGLLAGAINRDFGSFAKFREAYAAAAQTLFGSGWTWLVLDAGRLKVVQTFNADLPMKHGQTPLFVLDVWEHAYYIDYRNARPKYIDAVFDHLINWDFAAANYARAVAVGS
ncbi:MAG: superoxide dismutase [Elusimicrobiales bacterium]|jgi:Fe-Mn family superoxide dismutase